MRLAGYVRRDLVRNPRRTLASLVGVIVGVGLFSAVLFFIDGSGASMTSRAIAPLSLDMQRVLTSPPGGGIRLERTVTDSLLPGQRKVALAVTNPGPADAHEVVVRDHPDGYTAGSTFVDNVPVPDVGGAIPLYQGAAGTGLNIGTVPAGTTRRVTYRIPSDARATPTTPATVSSRETPSPVRADAPRPVALPDLARRVAALPGVSQASPLVFVSLPGGITVGSPPPRAAIAPTPAPSATATPAGAPPPSATPRSTATAPPTATPRTTAPATATPSATATATASASPTTVATTASDAVPGEEPDAADETDNADETDAASTTPGVEGPVKLFAFDAAYQANYPSIRMISGEIRPGGIAISAEAARDLHVGLGDTVSVELPGDVPPLTLPVSGITDLSGARPLFESREWRRFEKFVYAPYTVIVDPTVYAEKVAPAFALGAAVRNTEVASYPFEELDVRVDRSRLAADPADALAQAQQVAAAVRGVAPEQDELIDNLSNTLTVAKGDARIAKRMFVFLGLPGAVLAAILTAYAASLLAAAQRRESALLRVRGASGRALTYLLTLRTLALAGLGAVLGTGLGFVVVVVVLGSDVLFEASTAALVQSGLIALGGGVLVTALALWLPGRRAARQEITVALASAPHRAGPAPWRVGVETLALAGAVIAQVLALRHGAFDAPPGSVYSGRSVTLPLYLLIAPLVGWLAGTMLIAHLVQAVTAGARVVRGTRRFSAPVRGVLWRSITRRLRSLASGVVAVALVVGLGTMLACFATSWDRAEARDARFTVGSDLRLTPNPTSGFAHPESLALGFTGVGTATGVVYSPENAALAGLTNDDVASLAAIDPAVYPRVAPLPDALFPGWSAAQAMTALAEHPDGILVNAAAATSLEIKVGDPVRVTLARDTDHQVEKPSRVLGLFTRFPGAPTATDVVANLHWYEQQTGLDEADYFLLAARDHRPATVAATLRSVDGMPSFARRFDVTTAAGNLDKDRSSLTALNVRGLLHLDSLFTFLMAATATAMFVFGLLLQRRREYVTLRAQGLQRGQVRRLVLAEAGISSVLGAVIGVGVGVVAAGEFVRVLRPIFLLTPTSHPPAGDLGVLVGLLLAATALAGVGAAVLVNRLQPTELLREE